MRRKMILKFIHTLLFLPLFFYINIKKIVMAHLMLKFDIILTSILQQWTSKAIFFKIYCHK